MSRAYVLVREAPWYRRQAFTDGLKSAGYDVQLRHPDKAAPGDVLCAWNRYGATHDLATRFERDGGTVLVAENGYIGAGGSTPKFDVHPRGPTPDDYYALSVHGHNGSGRWPVGGPERWEALNLPLAPWRESGRHILICGQRSIGSPTMSSPPGWNDRMAERIRKQSKRPVVVRQHPGNDAPKRPLDEDLKDAWACVIWSSGSGLKALVKGIPVFYDAPFWIASGGAARCQGADWERPVMDDTARLNALQRMAWAQWRVRELMSGEPFKLILGI